MIYIVVPLYNEEKNVENVISGIREELAGEEYKIIAVNDGSFDNTLDKINKLKGKDLNIVSYLVNMNIGSVIPTGLMKALSDSRHEDDVIILMEGDQTSSVSLVKDLTAGINNGNDVVIASRYQKGGGYRNFPLKRKILSYCANFFLQKIFPINDNVKDYTIFLRAYRAGIFYKLIDHFGQFGLVQSKGFIANAELLIKISLFTNRIKEIPFVYDYGNKLGKSKMKILQTVNEYFVFTIYMKNLIKRMNTKKITNYYAG